MGTGFKTKDSLCVRRVAKPRVRPQIHRGINRLLWRRKGMTQTHHMVVAQARPMSLRSNTCLAQIHGRPVLKILSSPGVKMILANGQQVDTDRSYCNGL